MNKSSATIDILGISWIVASLVFFNFFRDYIAYYQEGVREPLITSDFNMWLWIHNPLLVLLLVRHSVSLVFKKYVIPENALIFLTLLAVASTATLLGLFPFDFSVFPSATAEKWTDLGLRLALILTIVVYGIESINRVCGLIQSKMNTAE